MLSPEQLRGHEDVLDDPRARFNRLCEALILSVSHNSRLSLRMVQEIHSLAQHIGAEAPAKEATMQTALPRHEAETVSGGAPVDRSQAAFRLRLPAQGRSENPFSSILDELAGVRRSVQMAHAALSVEPKLSPPPAAPAPKPATGSAPSPDYVNRLKLAVAQQNTVLEELVAGYKSNSAELQRLEDEMTRNPEGQGVAAELDQLRRTMQRQEQHLLALALAVKRLAAVLSE